MNTIKNSLRKGMLLAYILIPFLSEYLRYIKGSEFIHRQCTVPYRTLSFFREDRLGLNFTVLPFKC
jgi:hypothetical protein